MQWEDLRSYGEMMPNHFIQKDGFKTVNFVASHRPNGQLFMEGLEYVCLFFLYYTVNLLVYLTLSYNIYVMIGLGQNLATLEGLIALTILLKRYKFSLVPNQEIVYAMSLTHPIKNGLKVFVEGRQNY